MDESLETKMRYVAMILNNSATIFQLEESYYPPVPRFPEDAPDMPENENFYIIKHGIRLTGMPGCGNNFSDDELWKLTAFLSQMGKLPPSVEQEWKNSKSAAKSGNSD
jgi:hypothetical protein